MAASASAAAPTASGAASASHLANASLNLLALKEAARQELTAILAQFKPDKIALVLDKTLSGSAP
jgi:hypothetical protein